MRGVGYLLLEGWVGVIRKRNHVVFAQQSSLVGQVERALTFNLQSCHNLSLDNTV